MKDKKRFLLRAGAIVIFIFIFMNVYLIFIKKHECLDTEVYPNTDPTPNISKKNTVGQSFIAEKDYLSRIEIMLGTYTRTNNQDIFFQLREINSNGEVLVQKTFNASEVQDNLFHPIQFRPIRESKGKKYYFTLSSPLSSRQNSICAWMNKENIYPAGEYFFRGSKKEGDLVFRAYSKRPVITELDRIVRNYPGIFGKRWFLVVAIVFFEAIQLLVLLIIIKAGKRYV